MAWARISRSASPGGSLLPMTNLPTIETAHLSEPPSRSRSRDDRSRSRSRHTRTSSSIAKVCIVARTKKLMLMLMLMPRSQ